VQENPYLCIMQVTIDPQSGFCFGVVYAIEKAEDELDRSGQLYCLGDIVHNNMEVDRLRARGLEIIDHARLAELHDCKVLIRAHGEPPSTYETALKNNLELIDASCPVVLKLQHRVRTSFDAAAGRDGQILIYGETDHAEVNGLVGQTHGQARIVKTEADLEGLDYSRPVYLFSQTTKSTKGFEAMRQLLEERIEAYENGGGTAPFVSNDTICRQVSNREPQLRRFAPGFDAVIFVSGRKSSNGKALFEVCKAANPNSHFISGPDEIQASWLENATTVGICGATSTPLWLMQEVAEFIEKMASGGSPAGR
jgi:4-hydroxy-3-methylbut-2-enyl diphosphate reductase